LFLAKEQILDLLLIHSFVETGLKGQVQFDNRIFSAEPITSEGRRQSKTAARWMATRIAVLEQHILLMACCFPRREIDLLATKTG
jgi:hypothetical protein